jgi:DNA (cytosine-5)-methyltransferase 1
VPFAKSRRAQSSEDDETGVPGDVSPTINCFDQGDTRATTVVAQGFTYSGYSNKPAWITGDRTDCLPSSGHGDTSHQGIGVMTQMAVRRLTPMECERLQGFPDGYTAITFKGRPASDGPRYKAIGNSMAVPVMRWIGQRIAMVDAMP